MRQILTPSLLALLLTACNSPETSMTQTHSPATEATAEADVEAGGRGLAKLNPSPRKAYEVALTLNKAPGAFGLVESCGAIRCQQRAAVRQDPARNRHRRPHNQPGKCRAQEDFRDRIPRHRVSGSDAGRGLLRSRRLLLRIQRRQRAAQGHRCRRRNAVLVVCRSQDGDRAAGVDELLLESQTIELTTS